MKSKAKMNKKKSPKVTRDASLDKYDDVVFFPEKVQKAKETIARVGLPKEWQRDEKDNT